MKLYKIKNWSEIYENNRTRELKEMKWLPLPIKLNGDGYTFIMLQKNGAAIFGAFVTLLEVAAICDPRGTLIRNTKRPHDANSLSRLTRISENIILEMLNVCSSIDCNWLNYEEFMEGATIPQEGATIPQEGATIPQEGATIPQEGAAPVLLCNIMSSSIISSSVEAKSEYQVAVDDFKEMRKKIRKSLTDKAETLLYKNLEKLAPNDFQKQIEILNQSTFNCWQGVFPLKENYNSFSKNQPATNESIKKNIFDAELK